MPFHAPATPRASSAAGAWFLAIKPSCNTLEVELAISGSPAPEGIEGAGYEAGCWALAGRLEKARESIDRLPGADRYKAAGIVFEIAHPIADMGDDRSAGPIMSLVVEYWPNHYMALYHAGAANFAIDVPDLAKSQLTDFLHYYKQDDGWTREARRMLSELESR